MEKNIAVDYLRLSITDRCNLNCIYCTPAKRRRFLPGDEILTYEEMVRLAYLFSRAGINKLRITGGEPLIRKDIVSFIKMLRKIKELKDISMTTNGTLLKDYAEELKYAGIDRINVSLNTLRRKRFKSITGLDCFEDVWAGIMKSIECGLHPVKLNVILIKGINEDEILDFARLTIKYPLVVRFIELFPTNIRTNSVTSRMVINDHVKEEITTQLGFVVPTSEVKGNGPAEYFKLRKSEGVIGFISGSSSNFCSKCNRIRVDCTGRVFPCLFSEHICDLNPIFKKAGTENNLVDYIKNVLTMKQEYSRNVKNCKNIEMSKIGG